MNETEKLREKIDGLIPFDPLIPDETPDVVTGKILQALKEAGLKFVKYTGGLGEDAFDVKEIELEE